MFQYLRSEGKTASFVSYFWKTQFVNTIDLSLVWNTHFENYSSCVLLSYALLQWYML